MAMPKARHFGLVISAILPVVLGIAGCSSLTTSLSALTLNPSAPATPPPRPNLTSRDYDTFGAPPGQKYYLSRPVVAINKWGVINRPDIMEAFFSEDYMLDKVSYQIGLRGYDRLNWKAARLDHTKVQTYQLLINEYLSTMGQPAKGYLTNEEYAAVSKLVSGISESDYLAAQKPINVRAKAIGEQKADVMLADMAAQNAARQAEAAKLAKQYGKPTTNSQNADAWQRAHQAAIGDMLDDLDDLRRQQEQETVRLQQQQDDLRRQQEQQEEELRQRNNAIILQQQQEQW